MISKINISEIFVDHFATLKNESTGKISASDIAVFLISPLLLAGASYYLVWSFSETATNLVITGMSIFAGLMINVLVLIYTVALNTQSKNSTEAESAIERRFLRQIFANISFSICISVFIVVLAGVAFFVSATSKQILTAITIFLLGNFLLTLFMILKRLHILLTRRFS